MTQNRPNPTPLWTRLILANTGLISLGAGLTVAAILLRSDPTWFVVLLLLGVFILAFAGIRMLRLAQHENPAEAHPLPSDLPINQRLAIVRRGRWLIPLVLVPGSAWVAYDLYRLETGQVAEITLWGPIGDVYELFGFWPGVLFLPALTVGLVAVMFYGVRKLTREALEQQQRR